MDDDAPKPVPQRTTLLVPQPNAVWAAGPVSAIARPKLTLRCGGIAMALKGRPSVPRKLKATVDPRGHHVQFDGLGLP